MRVPIVVWVVPVDGVALQGVLAGKQRYQVLAIDVLVRASRLTGGSQDRGIEVSTDDGLF